MKDVVIIGGGLAGLLNAIALRKSGFDVTLFEQKKYPFHKVCGEYLSKEVVKYLEKLQIDLSPLNPVEINELHFSSPGGKDLKIKLDLGALGISRYALDHYLFGVAEKLGCTCFEDTEIRSVEFLKDSFKLIDDQNRETESSVCIAAYGRRTGLDRKLDRKFFNTRSGFVGVKAHYAGSYPKNLVGLHNFPGGYCGISNVEGNKVNVCYMSDSKHIKELDGLREFELKVVRSNPHIDAFLSNAACEFESPVVVSQMYFGTKSVVEDHILMCGDAAGAISPLTGNGMAMAVHGSKICSDLVANFLRGKINRSTLEKMYTRRWNKQFSKRIQMGNILQPIFGKPVLSDSIMSIIGRSPRLFKTVVSKTHGKPF